MKEEIDAIYEFAGCFGGTLLVILCIVLALAVVFGVFCFEGWIFMLLWNWLAVSLFSAPTIGYWLCVGIVFALNFIGRLIFGRHSTKVSLDD